MKLIDDTALRLAPLLYTPGRMREAMKCWLTMCNAALARGETGAAILIIPGQLGPSVVPADHIPEPRDNWALN